MSSDDSKPLSSSADSVKDIFLWRRKKLNVLVLLVVTVTWILVDVYEYNFITIASWLAMLIVTSLFLYGNLIRLFRKEEPAFSEWEVSEETTMKTANSVKETMEKGIRWMFNVSSERERFIFARVVAVLWLLAYVGSFFDFLTLLYIGTVGGMTVPVMYVKNEERIKRGEEWTKTKATSFYEKVVKRVKNRAGKVKEDKKVE